MRRTLAILLCFLPACRHPVYRLTMQGRTQILTPPPARPEIRNARGHPGQKAGCDVSSGSFSLQWRRNTALVTAKTEEYFAPPESAPPQPKPQAVTISEGGPRMYADSLADLEKFQDAMAEREDSGCLRGEETSRLVRAITETFALPPQIAAYLRFGTYIKTGFIDLTPGFLLRLVSPAADGSPDISLYEVTGAPGGDRVGLISGTGKALTIPETPAYFRYLYWTGASAHNFRATILGAPEHAALRDATRGFLDDPESYCAKPRPGIFCQSIGVNAGMNAGFYVRVNGHEVFARIGGTVGEAVADLTGLTRTIPHVTAVLRMYRGKLIPIKFDGKEIFSLVAMPGDDIVTQ